jgi:hypothetical protein
MKVWKKLSAVALALVMVMALSVMASAANETLTNGVAQDTTEDPYNYKAIGNTLEIPKSITVTGTAPKVYGPAVTYSYTIAGVDISNSVPTVQDNASHTARPVKSGVANGVTLSDVVFTSSEVALTSDTGTGTVTEKLVATVNLNQFSYPGIYRYAITEKSTNTAALYAAGVTRPAEDAFWLDVYIKNDTNATATNGLSVYGYVLLNANANITTTDDPSHKVSTLTTDSYATMDFTVTKSVTGNMGDKTNQFPFTIGVSNSGMNFYKGKTTAEGSATTDTSLSTTLANGESFVIKGLNPKATVTVTETNNTPDEYTVSVQDGATTPVIFVTAAPVAANGTKDTGNTALAVSNYDDANSTTSVTAVPTASNYRAITFINDLEAISPTGVALRYAPYLAMMGAGVVALPLSLRKKEELD